MKICKFVRFLLKYRAKIRCLKIKNKHLEETLISTREMHKENGKVMKEHYIKQEKELNDSLRREIHRLYYEKTELKEQIKELEKVPIVDIAIKELIYGMKGKLIKNI